jgi:DsbC/DsbD-like thiol-disulfide interchange protein/cytochrome c biogenesis protein CcdA
MQASALAFFRSIVLLLVAALAVPLGAQAPARENYIAADLVAEQAPVAGETLTVALRFRPREGWHGYWVNPGDAGAGMVLDWRLPEGWQAGEPQYPVPHRLLIAGLMNHVYEEDYAVLVPITVPAGAAVGNFAPITVDAQWLACSDRLCVPEQALLTLRIPQTAQTEAFDEHRAAIAPLIDSPARFALTDTHLRLAIPLPAAVALSDSHVFLEQQGAVDYAAAQRLSRVGDVLVAEIPRGGLRDEPGIVSGILTLDGQGAGLRFTAEPGEVPTGGEPVGAGASSAPLILLLGGALLGGLLLNLMPCVFPILSLKALTLARAGESETKARAEALAYTAGVVLACLALGGLLLALRAGGAEIGWAFQLQQPLVVAVLLVLAAAITANLAGVFDLPSLSITRSGGRSSAFATGLLAAFVATPCTGPFMAAALGAALVLPLAEGVALFGALGLGLALPFLLLGFVPALRRRLPAPGAWMERLRRLLAVPMGLTALALVWLAARTGGQGFALVALVLVAGLVIALAVVGRLQRGGKLAWPAFGLIAAPFAIFAAFALPASIDRTASVSAESLLNPVPFSAPALAEARASGQPVFLWFTADWCLTCKVNERVAIEREPTRAAFAQAGVIAMRGDWTRGDPAIARFLEQQGAAGVPLYLWYPAGGGAGEQLPQVLGPDSLVDLAGG